MSTLGHARFVALVAMVALVSTPGAAVSAASDTGQSGPWDPHRGILIDGATVVTMDDRHTVLEHGRVLIRDQRIVAVWQGRTPPGVDIGSARVIDADASDLIFPGLINLHDHPREDFLHAWPAPSSHALPEQGKAGTDPYANRYQWGGGTDATTPLELKRLVSNPADVLAEPVGLGLGGEIVKYAEVAGLLGGETSVQGAPRNPESDGVLARNIDNDAFDTRIAQPRVGPIEQFGGPELASLRTGMTSGAYDAWMIHLAEGVRDADRRPGDPVSSRGEFETLRAMGLLTDITVIIHGTALERADFAAMRAAPSGRSDGVGDGRGAKLVWSPLSNLLLYGRTAHVFEALAEGVNVSLGTDWTPSGSRTLLDELKIADIALRDRRILGNDRDLVPDLAIAGRTGEALRQAEINLDRTLVDMVTTNPARALRWDDRLGSVEAGKLADLVMIHAPDRSPTGGLPAGVYRSLIDASERDVELVLVGGDPLAGDVGRMADLKPNDYEVVTSRAARFRKAVDATSDAPVPESGERLTDLTAELEAGVAALGGDHPPIGGGPGPSSNTYSYLKAHVSGGQAAGLPDDVFRGLLESHVGSLPDGSLNLERVQLLPLFATDDDFLRHLLHGDLDGASGLIADPTPPFRLYPANLNQVGPEGNPFEGLTP
jgi:5-methylthioadenosine/S-adenosylhomocysteine deaminase